MKADPEVWRLTQEAGAAFQRRDFAAAKQAAQALLLRRPLDPNANQILGLIALEAGDAATAKRRLETANQAAPNQPQILNTLGVVSRRLGEVDAARAAFTRAGELGLIDGWRNLGNLEELEQNAGASIAAYERALKIAPQDAASHAGLAQAFEKTHDLARAMAHAREALARDPGNVLASLALGQALYREKQYAEAEAAALPVTRNARATETNRALAWGVVGDARDGLEQAHEAFAAYNAGNHILRAQNAALLSATERVDHPAGVRRMIALVERTDVSAWPPQPSVHDPAPVFLIGFPRSGTTLFEQVLSSHSALHCIEEREHFANALAGTLTDADELDAFAAMPAEAILAARADYWRRVRADEDVEAGKRVVDKLPLNIVVLPLIKRVFPDAKIIFALRDPRDVILSCFQQRFGMNAAMAQFLDIEDAANYYDVVMRLFLVCRERLALDLHQVRYEDVVADLEKEARAAAAFLELPFEEAMLNPQATAMKRNINTPSLRQVVQPIYSRSVGKWRRYETDLAPALPVLTLWAERWGYPR